MVTHAIVMAAAAAVSPNLPPAELPVTAADLVEVADISGLVVSPDGASVAYRIERASIADNKVTASWFVAPIDGGKPGRRIGDGGTVAFDHAGGIAPETAIWSPDSRWLYYRARIDGETQVWKAAAGGNVATRLTSDDADVVDFKLGSKGATVTYHVRATRAAVRSAQQNIYDEGMRVDATTDLAQPVAGGRMRDGERRMQRFTGDWFDRIDLLGDVSLTEVTVAIDGQGATRRVQTNHDKKPELSASVGAGSDRLELSQSGLRAHLTVQRADGSTLPCPQSACPDTLVAAIWLPDRRSVLLTTRPSPRRDSLSIWRAGEASATPVVSGRGRLGGDRSSRSSCAATASRAICVAAAATSPPRLVSIDFRSGQEVQIADPNAALRNRIAVTATDLQWKADGTIFHGVLLAPKRSSRPPALVINYYACDGFLRGGVGDELPMLPLVGAGQAILCIAKPSLSGPFDATRNYTLALEGIRTITAQLAEDHSIDPARVGMSGFSFGSEVTMWTAYNSSLLKAAAIASTQINTSYFWANALPGRNLPTVLDKGFGLGWPDRDPAIWAKVSPAQNTTRLRTPLLMQLPEDEARWMGETLASGLRDGKAIELYAFADEAHAKMQPRHKLAAYTRNFDWFRFWLDGNCDPAPDKHEQYRRWFAFSNRAAAGGKPLDIAHPKLDIGNFERAKIIGAGGGQGCREIGPHRVSVDQPGVG